MRVILETPAVPTTFTDPHNGEIHEGNSSIQVLIYDPGEIPRRGDGEPKTVPTLAQWRKQSNATGAIVVHPATDLVGAQPAVVVPALLVDVPETALVEFKWTFSRSGR